MAPGAQDEITALVERLSGGDARAADSLVPLVWHELRRLAQSYLSRERTGHTLQPTALVNEAYLRLVTDQARTWRNRAHFIGVTASIMRRVLVDHARRKQAAKRGGSQPRLESLAEIDGLPPEQDEELLALDAALDRLSEMNARQRQIVEMRYFGGLSLEETAEALGVSTVTVKRDWVAARAWLKAQVRPVRLN